MKTLYIKPNILRFALILVIICGVLQLRAEGIAGISISGTVKTSDGKPAAYVNVFIKELKRGTVTDDKGSFTFRNIREGVYTISAAFVGLQKQEQTITVAKGEVSSISFVLVETSERLDEVVVTARRSKNQVPVSIGKVAIKPIDLPQSIAVVGSEFIAQQQANKLSDVIKNVNGVALGTTRGATAETFFARGYNLGANNIMKNGSRSNSAVIPEASTLERIEVLKGSAALLYGNVSGGAVINMVTKQPKFEYGGEVSMRTGSYDFYKPTGDIYGPISKKVAFRVIGTYEDAKSYRNGVKSDRYYVNPSLLYKISGKTELLVQGDYMTNNLTPDFGIGTLDNTKIPTSISRNSFFNTPWAYNTAKQATSSANLNHQLNDRWKLNFVGSYQRFDRNYFSTERIQADAAGDWSRVLTRSKISEDYYTGQLNLTGDFKTGKIGHQLLVGTDAEQYLNKTHAFNLNTAYDKINILDPSKYTPRTDEPVATITKRTETPTYRLGYYAQDLISLSEKFKVLAGLRWSYQKAAVGKSYDVASGNRVENTAALTKYDKAISPRLGVVYQPVKNTSIFASYSNNFSPNTGTDVDLANLQASIIDQYEVGVKNDFFKGFLTANFTLYKIINHDFAVQAQYLKDGVTVNTNTTIKEFAGETTSDGAELDLSGNILSNLNFMAGYSYNFMRYTNTTGATGSYFVGERLVGATAHTANATLFYTLTNTKLKGLKLGASGFYTGSRNGGWNNTYGWKDAKGNSYNRLISIGSFTTFDLSAGYSFRKLSVLAKVSNITDALSYYVHENYSVNPIAPRQFITTLSYKF